VKASRTGSRQQLASYFSHLSREKSLRPSSIWVYLIYIDTQLHWLDSKKLTKPYSPHPGSKKRGENIVESRRHEPVLHRSYTSQNVMWSSGHFSTYITRVLITVSVNLSCIWLFAKGISIVRHMGLKYVKLQACGPAAGTLHVHAPHGKNASQAS
jgi:hypothetical protein